MKSVNNRVAIGIDFSGEDAVGKAFVYALQDQLNRSSILQYGTNSDEGLVLSIVAVNDNPGNDNNNNPSATIEVVLVGKQKDQLNWFIDEWVLALGKDKTDDRAKRMLAAVNADVKSPLKPTSSNQRKLTEKRNNHQ